MLFKIFGRQVQFRSPIKIYRKNEPILLETESEFTKTFGKPNVNLSEYDKSIRTFSSETPPMFVVRERNENEL